MIRYYIDVFNGYTANEWLKYILMFIYALHSDCTYCTVYTAKKVVKRAEIQNTN